METSSVSKIQVILELRGKGKIKCELKRHLSPRTMGIISRSLPLEGNAHVLGKNIVYMETPIDSGVDRPRAGIQKKVKLHFCQQMEAFVLLLPMWSLQKK